MSLAGEGIARSIDCSGDRTDVLTDVRNDTLLRLWFLAVMASLAVLGLSGCATPQVAQLQQQWVQNAPQTALLKNVPFYPQEAYQCGPAALYMAATAAGAQPDPEALVHQVYVPGRQGALQVEMMVATRRQGLLAYPLKAQVDAVLREVAAGNPVVVLQNLSFSFAPVWHYAVVIGYDIPTNTITLHSGRTQGLTMSLFTFERTWARGNYWAMLALQPSRLPATADADAYTGAAAALERINPGAAQTAYVRALAAWPAHRTAMLGAGNTAYALGQLDVAIEAYRQTTAQHADFADAWNNLAQALLDAGQLTHASSAIARAVALGGARQTRYVELQRSIETALATKNR